jgi:hypothetical protein
MIILKKYNIIMQKYCLNNFRENSSALPLLQHNSQHKLKGNSRNPSLVTGLLKSTDA